MPARLRQTGSRHQVHPGSGEDETAREPSMAPSHTNTSPSRTVNRKSKMRMCGMISMVAAPAFQGVSAVSPGNELIRPQTPRVADDCCPLRSSWQHNPYRSHGEIGSIGQLRCLVNSPPVLRVASPPTFSTRNSKVASRICGRGLPAGPAADGMAGSIWTAYYEQVQFKQVSARAWGRR
jgi:hypothetical protein